MKLKDRIYFGIAKKLPRKLLYFCVIQAWAITTTEKHTELTPTEVNWDMVCKYLEGKEKQ